jgi:outer membrane protein assembly factor BamD (BamD/ComL family)
MSTAVMTTNRLELASVADGALKAGAKFWFVVTMISQLVFAFTVASFYSLTAARGDYHKWNFTGGYTPGYSMGNTAVVMHVVSAAIVMLSGWVQLIPQVRSHFPGFHRWNGRIYMLTAVTLSVAGLYMTWFRGSVGGIASHMGSTVNAILIWVCAAMALRYALARDFRTHRRWALRFFLVVSASWFFRLGFFVAFLIFRGPFGFDPVTFTGPFITFMAFGQYLVPLAVLEIYLRAQVSAGAGRRMATAIMLFVLALATAAGSFAVGAAVWAPQVKAAFDPRQSIAKTLSGTIESGDIDGAVKQYQSLKAATSATSATYNFDEDELNSLGYQLLRAKKFKEAIRIFQLNIEAYPKSANTYDSLGEAYMDDGNKALAVVNYEKSLQLNPKNVGAVKMLQKLNGQ